LVTQTGETNTSGQDPGLISSVLVEHSHYFAVANPMQVLDQPFDKVMFFSMAFLCPVTK